jgi:hypothetical protein
MIVAREIIEKCRTDLIDAAHGLVGSLSLLTLVSSRFSLRKAPSRAIRRYLLAICQLGEVWAMGKAGFGAASYPTRSRAGLGEEY